MKCKECKEPSVEGRSRCPKHLEMQTKHNKRRDLRCKKLGQCTSCTAKAEIGHTKCAVCLEVRRLERKKTLRAPNKHRRIITNARRHKEKLRRIVVEAYGNECACCGEDRYEFMTIDHKKNQGAAHRKRFGAKAYGAGLYRRLILKNFPDTYQLLCWNCNCAKGIQGFCPHERER